MESHIKTLKNMNIYLMPYTLHIMQSWLDMRCLFIKSLYEQEHVRLQEAQINIAKKLVADSAKKPQIII